MKASGWQRLDLIARQITPCFLTLLLVMLAMVPMRVPDLAPIMPWLAAIAVYYWAVHRPDLMPASAVFAIGLFHDLVAGTALGVGVLILLLIYLAIVGQRRFFVSRSFLVMWAGFAVIAGGACLLLWLLSTLLAGTFISPRPAMFQFLTTVAAYPLLAWLFAQVQRSLLR